MKDSNILFSKQMSPLNWTHFALTCLLNKSSRSQRDGINLLAFDLNSKYVYCFQNYFRWSNQLCWTPSLAPPPVFRIFIKVIIFQACQQETSASYPSSPHQNSHGGQKISPQKRCLAHLSFTWPQLRSLLFLAWVAAEPVIALCLQSLCFPIQTSYPF